MTMAVVNFMLDVGIVIVWELSFILLDGVLCWLFA